MSEGVRRSSRISSKEKEKEEVVAPVAKKTTTRRQSSKAVHEDVEDVPIKENKQTKTPAKRKTNKKQKTQEEEEDVSMEIQTAPIKETVVQKKSQQKGTGSKHFEGSLLTSESISDAVNNLPSDRNTADSYLRRIISAVGSNSAVLKKLSESKDGDEISPIKKISILLSSTNNEKATIEAVSALVSLVQQIYPKFNQSFKQFQELLKYIKRTMCTLIPVSRFEDSITVSSLLSAFIFISISALQSKEAKIDTNEVANVILQYSGNCSNLVLDALYLTFHENKIEKNNSNTALIQTVIKSALKKLPLLQDDSTLLRWAYLVRVSKTFGVNVLEFERLVTSTVFNLKDKAVLSHALKSILTQFVKDNEKDSVASLIIKLFHISNEDFESLVKTLETSKKRSRETKEETLPEAATEENNADSEEESEEQPLFFIDTKGSKNKKPSVKESDDIVGSGATQVQKELDNLIASLKAPSSTQQQDEDSDAA